jgi:hypothetical protein
MMFGFGKGLRRHVTCHTKKEDNYSFISIPPI